jgi:hypothetical protein
MYCSSSIIRIIKSRRMRWAGHVARRTFSRNGGEEKYMKVIAGKARRKRPLGRRNLRSVDQIKTDLRDIERVGMD